jgi:hypothetical protein
MDWYGGGNVVVAMQELTTVHETIYGTFETRSETSLAGPGDGRTFMSSLLNGHVNEDVLNGLASLSRRNTNKYVDIFLICAYSNIP